MSLRLRRMRSTISASPATKPERSPASPERLESELNTTTPVRSCNCSAEAGGSAPNQNSEYVSSTARIAPRLRQRSASSSSSSSDAQAPVGLCGVTTHTIATRRHSISSGSGSHPPPAGSFCTASVRPAARALRSGTG